MSDVSTRETGLLYATKVWPKGASFLPTPTSTRLTALPFLPCPSYKLIFKCRDLSAKGDSVADIRHV